VTVQIPEEDIYSYTKPMLLAHIKVLMGGRAAEDLVFHTTTTGAGNDLARATDVARKMVCEWGMSEAFGPVVFGSRESAAADGNGPKGFSEATALEIDAEVRKLVTMAYDQVRQLLDANMETMRALTQELVAKETLGGADIDAILASTPPAAGA
jgi:cell division protease FtsH